MLAFSNVFFFFTNLILVFNTKVLFGYNRRIEKIFNFQFFQEFSSILFSPAVDCLDSISKCWSYLLFLKNEQNKKYLVFKQTPEQL